MKPRSEALVVTRSNPRKARRHFTRSLPRKGLVCRKSRSTIRTRPRLSGRPIGARTERASEIAVAARATAPRFIDERYRIEGRPTPPWRPVRVYNDGVKTIIQFPAGVTFGDLPTLVALADDPSFLHLDSLFNGPTKTLAQLPLREGPLRGRQGLEPRRSHQRCG